MQTTIRSVQAAQTTQGNTVGAYAEKFVRVERVLRRQDLELRRNVEITTGDPAELTSLPSCCAGLLGCPLTVRRCAVC